MKETPQQKYQRLLHEVQELTTEVEKIKVTVLSAPQHSAAFVVEEQLPAGREIPELWVEGMSLAEFEVTVYLVLLNSVFGGRRDDSVTKSTGCSSGGLRFYSQHLLGSYNHL